MEDTTISYAVIAFTNLESMATFCKDNLSAGKAKQTFDEKKKSGKYKCIVLRKETMYHDCGVEISAVSEVWKA